MEIQHLRHLVASAENSSFAKAAKKSFTSRQNVAHSIKLIESELGITLFERRGNEMVLTDIGEQLFHEAKDIVERVDDLSVMFSNTDKSDTLQELAVSNNLFAGIPSATASFIHSYSKKLRILELDCKKCYERVCLEKADIAIAMCMKREFPDCNVHEIARSPAFAVVNVSSALAQRETLGITDLAQQELLLMSEPTFQYEPLFAQFNALGFNEVNVSVITTTSSMIHMVRRYGVVGIVSKKFAVEPPEGVCTIPLDDDLLDWHFYILYKMGANNLSAGARFVQGIQRTFDESMSTYEAAHPA